MTDNLPRAELQQPEATLYKRGQHDDRDVARHTHCSQWPSLRTQQAQQQTFSLGTSFQIESESNAALNGIAINTVAVAAHQC
jgi:hypothetical protein